MDKSFLAFKMSHDTVYENMGETPFAAVTTQKERCSQPD